MSHHHKMHPYTNTANTAEHTPETPNPNADEQQPEAPQQEQQAEIPAERPAETAVDPKAEIEDMRLRMAAEMDNFKKRLTREHQEQMRYAAEKILGDLLPALDNLDMAIQYGSTHEACQNMMQGIEMTRRQLLDAVGKNGLVSVGEKGEPFDPAKHEAIGVEADASVDQGAVSKVLQRGYKLHDRLLRPAKVMVNN